MLSASAATAAVIAALAASTAILLIFVILLFACKPFRNLFFRSENNRTDGKKIEGKSVKKPTTQKKDAHDNNAAATKAPSRAKKEKNGGSSPEPRVRLPYSDSVPTVPLIGAQPTAGKEPHEEDIMKLTHDALVAISNSKPRASSGATEYVQTIVIPPAGAHDKTAAGVTGERRKYVTNDRQSSTTVKTGERSLPRTIPRTAPRASTATPSVRTATKPAAKTAQSVNTAKSVKPVDAQKTYTKTATTRAAERTKTKPPKK